MERTQNPPRPIGRVQLQRGRGSYIVYHILIQNTLISYFTDVVAVVSWSARRQTPDQSETTNPPHAEGPPGAGGGSGCPKICLTLDSFTK